ncbi:MAG TPA: SMP-30/gluconolactonase/LRE family protein [Terriglobales bacterium]|nr:SMP-30/gluconolactonase/LRE family protein [Terriglobales bacterium]
MTRSTTPFLKFICLNAAMILFAASTMLAADAARPVAGAEVVRLDKALDALIAPGTQIEKVAGGFKFTEGPMWREGRLWISDVVGDKIFAVSPTGKVDLLVDKAGGYNNPPPDKYLGPNAMVTDKDGTVILAQQGGRKVMRITENKDGQLSMALFLDTFDGKKFNSPNDLVFSPDGTLWFTDPSYGLAGGDKDPLKEIPFNGVYRYSNGKLTAAIKDLTLPNGLGFSPDGKTFYVCNSGPKMAVHQYHVASDGSLSEGPILISFPDGSGPGVPDGMKLDSAGNIWTTAPGGIRIIAPDGKLLGQIKLPETAANLAWADGGSTLYITAQTSVYRLKVATPGKMPLYQK